MPGNPDGIQAFAEGDDSALLIGTRRGIKRFADGEMQDSSFSGVTQQQWVRRMLPDRELWKARFARDDPRKDGGFRAVQWSFWHFN
jgi:hypothetical protein